MSAKIAHHCFQGLSHVDGRSLHRVDRSNYKERIVAPFGHFETRPVSWLSRLEIKIDGRPVLETLTTEPFRRETVWLAEGYGIIRRQIEYLGVEKKQVTFDLARYWRPEKK